MDAFRASLKKEMNLDSGKMMMTRKRLFLTILCSLHGS